MFQVNFLAGFHGVPHRFCESHFFRSDTVKVFFREGFFFGQDRVFLDELIDMDSEERDPLSFFIKGILHPGCERDPLFCILVCPDGPAEQFPGNVVCHAFPQGIALAAPAFCLLEFILKDGKGFRCADHDHRDADRIDQCHEEVQDPFRDTFLGAA